IDFLQGITACNGHAFLQIRTRSSITNTSDLKDTTKFLQYTFGGPTADLALQSNCGQTFSYSAAGSHDSVGGGNLTYNWTFHGPAGMTSSDAEFGPDANFPGDATRKAASFTSDTVRNVNVPVTGDYADVD